MNFEKKLDEEFDNLKKNNVICKPLKKRKPKERCQEFVK